MTETGNLKPIRYECNLTQVTQYVSKQNGTCYSVKKLKSFRGTHSQKYTRMDQIVQLWKITFMIKGMVRLENV
jgi:hypothetical protein